MEIEQRIWENIYSIQSFWPFNRPWIAGGRQSPYKSSDSAALHVSMRWSTGWTAASCCGALFTCLASGMLEEGPGEIRSSEITGEAEDSCKEWSRREGATNALKFEWDKSWAVGFGNGFCKPLDLDDLSTGRQGVECICCKTYGAERGVWCVLSDASEVAGCLVARLDRDEFANWGPTVFP